MSDKKSQDSAASPAAQTQSQRWLTYGSNVAVTCAIVILLAGMLVYLTQRFDRRFDTTSAGLYSLKPQTLQVIQNTNQHIRIISLYTRQKPPEAVDEESTQGVVKLAPAVQAQAVADLLAEYKNNGRDIDVENIDPILNPGKVDALIHSVVAKYNTDIVRYQAFIKSLTKQYEEIKDLSDKEIDKLKALTPEKQKITSEDVAQTLNLVALSVVALPRQLKDNDDAVQRMLTQKLPDYRGITDSVESAMTFQSASLGKIIDDFTKYKDDKDVPPALRDYMVKDLPQYQKLKDLADALAKSATDVGHAKLDNYDTLRDALLQNNPILVEGDFNWRIIPYEKVWKTDQAEARQVQIAEGGELHPQFAGEQMITTAIIGLQMKQKPKVCFVRAGGAPVASEGIPGVSGDGMFAGVADILRDYNFDVTERDLTGFWAYRSQGQGPPEPTEAEIADAIWIVFANPAEASVPGMGPQTIAPKVADHLSAGHPALILTVPGGDNYQLALSEWGITLHSDYVCVHEPGKGAVRGDWADKAQQEPPIFLFTNYGDIPLARPLRSLPGIIFETCPVQVEKTKGITAESFLPLPGAPDAPASWATKDIQGVQQNKLGKLDKSKGDLPGPLFTAATAENAHGQRIVAVGSPGFMLNGFVSMPDPELLRRGIVARRFPGDPQLFANIVFWLAHEDSMIAISPSAMDVSRVHDMGKVTQVLIRYGVLLVLLPALVLAAGVGVYLMRRD